MTELSEKTGIKSSNCSTVQERKERKRLNERHLIQMQYHVKAECSKQTRHLSYLLMRERDSEKDTCRKTRSHKVLNIQTVTAYR